MKVLEAADMDEPSRDDTLSEKLVRDGSLINTKIKGAWRGHISMGWLEEEYTGVWGYG